MTTVADGSYRTRILGLLGERNPIESLEDSARRVEETARRLGEAGLARSWGPGKWTGKQILAHLADAEVGVGFRVRQVLAEDHHTIQPFDEEAWARRYADVDVTAALGSFLGLRRWNLALFRSLSKDDLAREAVHPERGPETLGTIVRLLAGHDLNHLAQLERLSS
jgi:DinB family protein